MLDSSDRRSSPDVRHTYNVFVDDNFHYTDESQRYAHGEFESCESAIDACKRIVDEFFFSYDLESATPEYLWQQYAFFGEDPFIVSTDSNCRFSARDYASRRCREICGMLDENTREQQNMRDA
jgi:hypothetical protein